MDKPMLTFDQLKTHLREGIEIMRVWVNPAAYRNQFFALFLLKRLQDLFFERFHLLLQAEIAAGRPEAEARALAADPDEHRVFVPPEAHWRHLLAATEHVGETLERACSLLEGRNLQLLSGVLSRLRFMPPRNHAASGTYDHMLMQLLQHFDTLALGNQQLAPPEIIGKAGEYLIHIFAQFSGRRNGSFASPGAVTLLLAELLRPEEGMRIYDPTCGAGGALLACAQFVTRRGGNPQNLSLFGQEHESETWALCKMNLLLHDLPDSLIRRENCLTTPLLTVDNQLMQFDVVLAEPPFSSSDWGHDEVAQAQWGRFEAGLPPPKRGDFAFVQHALASLNATGSAALIVPHGILFRGGIEAHIRASLLQLDHDVLEAVIGLPAGMLYGTNAPAAVLVLRRKKRPELHGRVLFIDGTSLLAASHATQAPALEGIMGLAALYHAAGDTSAAPELLERLLQEWGERWQMPVVTNHRKPGTEADMRRAALDQVRRWQTHPYELAPFVAVASLQEITEIHGCRLNLSRYLAGYRHEQHIDIRAELDNLRRLEAQRQAAESEMDRLLRDMGYSPSSPAVAP